MRIRIPRVSIIILVLLLAAIAVTAISTFLFTRLDEVVHSDLYRYGLQFSYEWAEQYWINARLMLSLLAIAMTVSGIPVILILVRLPNIRTESVKFICSLLLIVAVSVTVFSEFLFYRIDTIVHGDLYRYGLQFSYEWATLYWAYAKSILVLLDIATAAGIASMGLMLAGERIRQIRRFLSVRVLLEINLTKLVSVVLFATGAIAVALSINYTSQILAFIGLGLVFWGAILFYIRPERYVKTSLFEKTTAPLLTDLNRLIRELGYTGKGIYLPPKYLKDFESSKVYVSGGEDTRLPSPEDLQKEDDNNPFLKSRKAILITPPGAEISKLFEATLGTNFTKVDLQYIEQSLPKLLVEDMEIAQSVEIATANDVVHVRLEYSVYKNMCAEAEKNSNLTKSLGCPLCSAIACTLAKATGRPIIIEKDRMGEDGRIIYLDFRLLQEPIERT